MDDITEIPSSPPPSRHDAPQHDMSRHTLTIKQASALFANLGVPRSARSIQRFCEIGSIDCIRVKGDKTERYFINQPSVERYAKELQQLEHISRIEDDMPRHDAMQRDIARHDAPRRDEPLRVTPAEPVPAPVPSASEFSTGMQEQKSRIDVLEKENLQLKIDRSAKEQVIGHIMDERGKMIDRMTELSRDVGRLETQLLQLAAPQHEASRHDATDRDTVMSRPESVSAPVEKFEAVVMAVPELVREPGQMRPAEIVAPQPSAPSSPAPTPPAPRRESVWSKIFR